MHDADNLLGCFESVLNKYLVDDRPGGGVRQSALCQASPCIRTEVPLHSINANRDTVDERERLGVFREHGNEHTWDNVTKPSDASISGAEPSSIVSG
jgi:hypothetical protein